MNEPKTILCTIKEALENGLQVGDKFAIEYTLIERTARADSVSASALQINGYFKEFFLSKSTVIAFAPKLDKETIIIDDICTLSGEKPENHFVVVDIEGNTISIYSNDTGAIEVERENLTIIKRGGVAFFDK